MPFGIYLHGHRSSDSTAVHDDPPSYATHDTTTVHESSDDPPPYATQDSTQDSTTVPASSDDPPLYTSFPFIERTLHVYKDDFSREHLTIKDCDNSTSLYTVANHGKKGHSVQIEVFRSSPFTDYFTDSTYPAGSSVGNINFDFEARKILLSVNNRPLEMTPVPNNTNTCSFHFDSSMGFARWQYGVNYLISLTLDCVIEWTEICIAKFELVSLTTLTTFKQGKLKLVACRELDQHVMDEIVLSGIAMLEQHKERHIHE